MTEHKIPEIGSRWVGRKGRSEVEVVGIGQVWPLGGGWARLKVISNEHTPNQVGKVASCSFARTGRLYGYTLKEES